MEKKLNNYLFLYLLILLSFSYFFLFIKHEVGNDSTISEWLINYEGGFTKRGLVGQTAIEISRFFDFNLRWTIFLLQSLICTIYFFLLYRLLRNLKSERIIVLSILTPIFILYPVAEIEVLARKEVIVFSSFLLYLLVPRHSNFKLISFIVFTTFSILVWEPIIFLFPLILLFECIENEIEKLDFHFFKIVLGFIPSIIVALIIIFKPLTVEQHNVMSSVLSDEFNQNCYMSCGLLKTKSSIYQQFESQFGKYSLEVFVRYFLIILVGFYPLLVLLNNSKLKNKNLFLLKFFKRPIYFFSISLSPIIILFAMGYDWGRWVNVTYVLLAIVYFYLLNENYLILNYKKLKANFIYKIKGTVLIIFFILFCFGWNPKTVITGDVASFPGYRIPYKVFKILSN